MPITWILSDGKAGTEGQAIGLANALGLEYTLHRVKAKWPWRWLPAWLWFHPLKHITSDLIEALNQEKPDIILAGGRVTAMPAKYLREKYGAFTVFILNPYISPKHFDLVICPEHDHLKGDNVLEVKGALHRLTDASLKQARKEFAATFSALPDPRISVLIGGNTKHVTFTPEYMKDFVETLKMIAKQSEGSLMITASRRTPTDCITILIEQLKSSDISYYLWDGQGSNPYMGMLAWGDVMVVTGDSASMATEATFTGKPVYIYDVPGNPAKFQEFHQSLYRSGYAKALGAANHLGLTDWKPKQLYELPRIAKLVEEKLQAKFDSLKKR